ncbi:FluC/FEX family fluoride channel [Rhodococcus chondri]|uniref:Fluoride-specific ion channel FluC n=1 Tax=Rhodococcus chondri TaxID=3065941 RepID=A0ABU7JPQ9_9NOCA|nr:CrcB family protein [Rhodococcus sp. CC-R104]MEE2032010.1 CrcB family protein [Rhodococcus sp. CC-R104]
MFSDDAPPHRRLGLLAAVALGGLAGTGARYALGSVYPAAPGTWPSATFGINIVGAFALGILLESLVRSGPDTGRRRLVRLAAGTGALGSFTTYSALVLDVNLLVRDGHPALATVYAGVSVLAGVIAAAAGIAAGAKFDRRRRKDIG